MLAVRAEEKASVVGQVGQGSSGLVTVWTSCRGRGEAKEGLRLSREGSCFETIHQSLWIWELRKWRLCYPGMARGCTCPEVMENTGLAWCPILHPHLTAQQYGSSMDFEIATLTHFTGHENPLPRPAKYQFSHLKSGVAITYMSQRHHENKRKSHRHRTVMFRDC